MPFRNLSTWEFKPGLLTQNLVVKVSILRNDYCLKWGTLYAIFIKPIRTQEKIRRTIVKLLGWQMQGKRMYCKYQAGYLLQEQARKWEQAVGPYYSADPPASLPWGVAWQMSCVKEKAEQHKFSFAGLHRMDGYVCFPSFQSVIKLESIYILLSLFRVRYC